MKLAYQNARGHLMFHPFTRERVEILLLWHKAQLLAGRTEIASERGNRGAIFIAYTPVKSEEAAA